MQEHFFETFEFFCRTIEGAFNVRNVELSNFRTCDFADVLDGESDGERISFVDCVCAQTEIGIFEASVGKSVAERILDALVCAVVIAVSDVNAFAIFNRSRSHTEVFRAEIIVLVDGEGFCKFARGIDFAVDKIVRRFAACLAAEIEVEYAFYVLVPVADFDGRAARKHHDDVFVDFQNFVDESDVRGGHLDVMTIVAFRFKRIGKSDEEKHDIFAFCRFDRFFNQALFVAFAFENVAVGVGIFLSDFVERVGEGRKFCGKNVARTTALIADLFCESADDGDTLFFIQRQNTVVFEKNRAAFCRSASDVVVLFDVKRDAFDFAHGVFVCKSDETKHVFVDIFFGESACFERLIYGVTVESATLAAGHFEIHTRFDAFGAIVHCAPVADYDSVISPFVAQDVVEEAFVVAQIRAVQAVVGAHNRGWFFCFDDMLESRHIDFTQSTLVHD